MAVPYMDHLHLKQGYSDDLLHNTLARLITHNASGNMVTAKACRLRVAHDHDDDNK